MDFQETQYATNGYILEKRLGQGASGTVWLIRRNDEYFALKHISYHEQIDPIRINLHGGDRQQALNALRNNLETLRREISIVQDLSGRSSHLVRYFDHECREAGSERDVCIDIWIRKEYCDHVLSDLIENRQIGLYAALRYIIHISLALVNLHSKGIVHRDIKPANIMVTGDLSKAYAKLDDFGQARRIGPNYTCSYRHQGTFLYSAPEVDDNMPNIDWKRADIFSMGTTAYETLTGNVPFWEDDMRTLDQRSFEDRLSSNKRCHRLGVMDSLDDCLKALLLKATHPDANLRFPDAEAMHEELVTCVKGMGDRSMKDFCLTRNSAAIERARVLYQALCDVRQQADDWRCLGNVAYHEGRTDDAAQCYRKAIDIDPDDKYSKENLDTVTAENH
ncbi:MAG: protein kinase [Thermodesulfobacteriota bacterium]